MLLFEQKKKKKKKNSARFWMRKVVTRSREKLCEERRICKRGGTRNAEIFKTVREKKKNLNELFSSGGNGGEEDVNMENDDDEEKEFVEKLVESNTSGKPKRKEKIGRRIDLFESELVERVHSISAQRFR